MRIFQPVVMITLCLLASAAQAAGFRFVDVPADSQGPGFRAAVWSPCEQPPGLVDLGQAMLPGVRDCPLPAANKKRPLIVMSHGRGGSFIGNHDTAEALADGGFIVAALDHPGDTTSDRSRSADLSVFVERPADIKRLVDFMFASSPVAQAIDAGRVGFFGFSRGGYTGLVAIGGNPDWTSATEYCGASAARICRQILAKEYPAEPLVHDPRIKAAVIADPLAVVFSAASLASIKVPVQLWASERGGDGVLPHDVAQADKSLPAAHEYRVVRNAGHFAFLAPCPQAMVEARPDLCVDQAGFDRAAFHQELNRAVLAFFRQRLEVSDE
jgi:predicted dienelactone hydrolase